MALTDQNTVVTASGQRVTDLFHQGRFTVPWHQRYYDWEPRNVDALLHDIKDALDDDRQCYFLGTVMLVEQGRSTWEINDGQQRMVTLSLICAALCRLFNSEKAGSQREGFCLRILFDIDDNIPVTLDESQNFVPRITPPQNNKTQYEQLIRGNSIGSNGKLTKAWRAIGSFFAQMALDRCEQYFDYICHKIEVVCLHIPPTIDSNAVYEAINCRGKKLVDLDLIRNYLYSHFSVESGEQRKTIHRNLETIRTVIVDQNQAFEFVRCFFQTKFGFLPKEDFYRYTREHIEGSKKVVYAGLPNKVNDVISAQRDYVFNLTGELSSGEGLELFRRIRKPSHEDDFVEQFIIDSGTTNARRNASVFLFELSGYKVTYPLVFSMLQIYMQEPNSRKKKLVAKSVSRNLRRLSSFVLRTAFVARKFETSQFEKEFSEFARRIVHDRNVLEDEFKDFLISCDQEGYNALDDGKFEASLQELHLKGVSRIRQFLLAINEDVQDEGWLLRGKRCSIEHILPRSPIHWNGWTGFAEVHPGEWSDRIGNLTLMTKASNKASAKFNQSFRSKVPSFATSGFQITKMLAEFEDWAPVSICQRERYMFRRAIDIWRFP